MRFKIVVLELLLLAFPFQPVQGIAYTLKEDYPVAEFFSKFDFFSCGVPAQACDPTHGFVQYVDQASARLSGLISTSNQSVIIRPDHTFNAEPSAAAPGRKSVRIESKSSYNHGLFIVDIKRMPAGVCGTWPSFWLTGSDTVWPGKGEIDIVEGVNDSPLNQNQMTLHTKQNCFTRAGNTCELGNGCSINRDRQTGSYGNLFNDRGGGVFAMEWTSSSIKVWFFPRDSPLLGSVLSKKPDPSSWGATAGEFQGGLNCDIDTYFRDLRIVINLTFCGDWAGEDHVYDQCKRANNNASCKEFVGLNPGAFSNINWEILSLRVFEAVGTAPTGSNIVTQPAWSVEATPSFGLRTQAKL